MTQDTNYIVTVEVGSEANVDATNYVEISDDDSSPHASGNLCYYNNSMWTTDNTKDLCLKIYGNSCVPATTSTSTSTTSTTSTSTTSATTTIPLGTYTIRWFDDSSMSKNVTFNSNSTIYVNMPKYSWVVYAGLNVSGYSKSLSSPYYIKSGSNTQGLTWNGTHYFTISGSYTLVTLNTSFDEVSSVALENTYTQYGQIYYRSSTKTIWGIPSTIIGGCGASYPYGCLVEWYINGTFKQAFNLESSLGISQIYDAESGMTGNDTNLFVQLNLAAPDLWIYTLNFSGYNVTPRYRPPYSRSMVGLAYKGGTDTTLFGASFNYEYLFDKNTGSIIDTEIYGTTSNYAHWGATWNGTHYITETVWDGGFGGNRYYYWLENQNITNISLDATGDGDYDWSFSGELNSTNSPQRTTDLKNEFRDYLWTCTAVSNNCTIPLVFHSDTAGILQADDLNVTYYNGYNYNVDYDSTVNENDVSDFYLYVKSNLNISNTYLVWNNTEYSASLIAYADDLRTYKKTLTIPDFDNSVNIGFYWRFDVDGSTVNTDTYTQSVNAMVFGVCNETLNTTALNFFIRDEDNETSIPANMEFFISSSSFNFSSYLNGSSNYSFCIFPSDSSVTINMDLIYYNSSYTTRNYYLRNATLSNATNNITLYLREDTHDIRFYLRDKVYLPVSNAIIIIQKLEWDTNSFKTVAMCKSDNDGECITYLKTEDEYYIFEVIDSSNNVYLFPTKQLYYDYTIGYVTVSLNIGDATEMSSLKRLPATCSYNSTTLFLSCWFTDTSGLHSTLCLDIYKKVGTSLTNHTYNYCASDVSAVYFTLVANETGDYYYTFTYTDSTTGLSYIAYSGYFTIYNALDLQATYLFSLLSGIVISCFGLLTIYKPEMYVIGTALGMIICAVLAIYNVTFGMLVAIGILGIVIIHKVKG